MREEKYGSLAIARLKLKKAVRFTEATAY